MIELNLLPDVKLQYVRSQKARRRVISIVTVGGIASVGLVVLVAFYVYVAQNLIISHFDGEIKSQAATLSQKKDLNNYLTLQQQLAALPSLHEAKPMYSRFISYLPVLNPSAPNNVHITRLSVDGLTDANTITLDAYAQTYTAATVFESTLTSAQFSAADVDPTNLFDSAVITNTALGQDSVGNKVVTFTVTLQLNDKVLAFDTQNGTVSVPNKNATNSAQNIPSEVFASVGGAQ